MSFCKTHRPEVVGVYGGGVPRLWNATIDEHRRTVHAAILDAAAALVDLPATRPARTRLVELTLAALRPTPAG